MELEYLVGWAYALHGRSGVGMAGVAPLGYTTIEAWSRLTGTQLEPYEVNALIALDAVLCSPETGEEETVEEPPAERRQLAWPTRSAP